MPTDPPWLTVVTPTPTTAGTPTYGNITGWPLPPAYTAPVGCICPPGPNAACQRPDCPGEDPSARLAPQAATAQPEPAL